MSTTTLAVLGVSSAVLQFISLAPYIADIVKGKTKPERATWWIWSLLNVVSLAAQIAAHATWSVLMTAAQALVSISIAALSLKYGYGAFRKKDTAALCLALFGVLLWWALSSPLAALIVVVLVGLLGLWLTLEKTWRAPYTETLAMWALGALSGLFSLAAIGAWKLDHIIFPLYVTVGNGLLSLVIIMRQPFARKPKRKA